jgi:pimeloyl-ACP methyl ester carboxylesterase
VTERIVNGNGIRIWTEDFGDRRNPALLLIMGASAQGIQWPEPFIERLVAGGLYVIRYDNRDTGQSTCFDFSKAPYTLDDLARDATAVLDAYDLASAHVAGASMGGMIVQMLMIRHAQRVRSATIVMSSPLAGSALMSNELLPGPAPEWMAKFAAGQNMPLDTPEQKIEMRVAMFTLLAGRIPPDTTALRAVATREVARATNFAAQANHGLAITASAPNDRRPMLRTSTIPTLVIHGTDDPILPYAHGKALADAIPRARLSTIDGMGHDLPQSQWPDVAQAIVDLTRGA